MRNAEHPQDIEPSVDVAADEDVVEAAPTVQAARAVRASAEEAEQAWAPSLARCEADLERAMAATRDLHAERTPLLLPARVDAEPAAVEQLARLTVALTTAVIEEADAAKTVALARDKASTLAAATRAADRRVLEARHAVSDARDAEAAVEVDAQLATAASFLARWVERKTQTARLAQSLGLPVAAGGRHPRRSIEHAVGFHFRAFFHMGPNALVAPLAGHVHATPAAAAWGAELARQAAEPAPPPEDPAAVAANDGWTRRG